MSTTTTERILRRAGVMPLVRATRNELEVSYLPPYGDPEVDLLGEAATYLLVSTIALELLERVGRE